MGTPALSVLLIGTILLSCGGGVTAPTDSSIRPPLPLSPPGLGVVANRYTAELWVLGNVAYTTTWRQRGYTRGNAINIWNVTGATPVLVDSVIVPRVSDQYPNSAYTLGDIQATDDGKLLVVATESQPGSILIYNINNPLKPQLVSRFANANTFNGVHTATLAVVNGKLYGFLCVDPNGPAGKLVIVDLSDPAAPFEVFSQTMGNPWVHDVFVRDGILMVALWNDGLSIFDIGGGGAGGTVANPKLLGNVKTVGGAVHNVWWFRDNANGTKRYALVGEEGAGGCCSTSSGDIHVVDVSVLTNPHEVAFYNVPGAGTHNFSVDEDRGVLFAAYYNAGVRAIYVRGDLGNCDATMKSDDGRCDLRKMGREVGRALTDTGIPVYVWGVFWTGTRLYASDMLNGLWRIEPIP